MIYVNLDIMGIKTKGEASGETRTTFRRSLGQRLISLDFLTPLTVG